MHASIYVSDLNRSIDFYSKLFAVAPEKIKRGYAKFHLDLPGLVFSLVENKERVAANFGHLGIQVASQSELEELKRRATESGVFSFEEKDVACCYARQDKFWAVDPDGVQWEVYYFHDDVEFNDPAYFNKESEGPCCFTEFSLESLPESAEESVTKAEMNKKAVPAAAEAQDQCCTPGGGCC